MVGSWWVFCMYQWMRSWWSSLRYAVRTSSLKSRRWRTDGQCACFLIPSMCRNYILLAFFLDVAWSPTHICLDFHLEPAKQLDTSCLKLVSCGGFTESCSHPFRYSTNCTNKSPRGHYSLGLWTYTNQGVTTSPSLSESDKWEVSPTSLPLSQE
jgi:hypothetical protein